MEPLWALALIKHRVFYVPHKFCIHAERAAIMKVKNKKILKECRIVIIRIDAQGNIIPAEPCSMCAKLLDKYKLTNINTIKENRLTKVDRLTENL